jgi:hypothetical protein
VQVNRFKSYECPGSVDTLRQSHASFFQSRPYCECYSKACGVSLHSRALKPIPGPERNISTGHRLRMLHSTIGDLLTLESFGLILTCLARGTAVCSKCNPCAWRELGELLRVLALIKLIYAKHIQYLARYLVLPFEDGCNFPGLGHKLGAWEIGAKFKIAAACDVACFVPQLTTKRTLQQPSQLNNSYISRN